MAPDGRDVLIHTFAGGRINNALARMTGSSRDMMAATDNSTLTVKRQGQAAVTVEEVHALPAVAEPHLGAQWGTRGRVGQHLEIHFAEPQRD